MAGMKTEKNIKIDRPLTSDIIKKVARIASAKLELREILDTIVQVIADNLGVDSCSICLRKPENKIICIESANATSNKILNTFCITDKDDCINKLFSDSLPVLIGDIRKETHIRNILNPEKNNLVSLLAVPVTQDGEISCIIIVQSETPNAFGQEEMNLLEVISYNIGAAIRNAQLYRSVKAQLDELKVVHEIGKAITSILNIDDLLPYICQEVSKVFNVVGCIIRLNEGDVLQIKASFGLTDTLTQGTPVQLGEGIAGNVALTGEPLIIDDVAVMPENMRISRIDMTSVICVPLKIGEQIIGTLALYDKKDEWGITTFTEDDLKSLMTFASAAAKRGHSYQGLPD
jgi:transcriptional regulator with GAF, ATPase, and Fis domain